MEKAAPATPAAGRLPSFTVRSQGVPAHRQREIWMGMGCLFEPAATATPEKLDFRLRGWNLGPILFSEFELGFPRMVRTRSAIRADHRDHYVLSIGASVGSGDAGGRPFRFGGGESVIVDAARAADVHDCVPQGLMLVIPRDALDAILPPSDLHGLVLGRGIGRLVGEHLLALRRNLGDLSPTEVGPVARATLSLIAAAVTSNADTLARAASPIDSALLIRAQRYIELNLQRPDLSAEDVRAACTISRARLYRLFEPFGGVMAYLQTRRLARAHMAFKAGEGGGVAQVAFRFGFRDESHFSRLFRRAFGESPSDCRRGAASVDATDRSPAAPRGQHVWSTWLDTLRG